MFTTENIYREKGFSLVELLCVMFISASLLVLVYKIYVKIITFYITQADRLEVEHNLMRATTLIRGEIQKAGNLGCAKFNKHFVTVDKQFFPYPLIGKASEFTIYYADYLAANLLEVNSNQMKVTQNKTFKENDYLLVSDCFHAEITQLKTLSTNRTTNLVLYKHLKETFQFPASVSRLVQHHFFVDEFDHVHHFFALYMKHKQKKTLLVPYVRSINILYYIVSANQLSAHSSVSVTDWDNLLAVKIKITMVKHSIKAHQILFVALRHV